MLCCVCSCLEAVSGTTSPDLLYLFDGNCQEGGGEGGGDRGREEGGGEGEREKGRERGRCGERKGGEEGMRGREI